MKHKWHTPRKAIEWESLARELAGYWRHQVCLGLQTRSEGKEPCLPCKARAIGRELRKQVLSLGMRWPESLEETTGSPCLDMEEVPRG